MGHTIAIELCRGSNNIVFHQRKSQIFKIHFCRGLFLNKIDNNMHDRIFPYLIKLCYYIFCSWTKVCTSTLKFRHLKNDSNTAMLRQIYVVLYEGKNILFLFCRIYYFINYTINRILIGFHTFFYYISVFSAKYLLKFLDYIDQGCFLIDHHFFNFSCTV